MSNTDNPNTTSTSTSTLSELAKLNLMMDDIEKRGVILEEKIKVVKSEALTLEERAIYAVAAQACRICNKGRRARQKESTTGHKTR